MNRYFVLLVGMLLLACLVSADVVPSAYSISPSTIKPGVSGSLTFTLTNTGNRSITGVELYPSGNNLQFFSNKVSVGVLGAGSSVPVTIPFRVSATAPAGIYNVDIAAYFVDVETQGFKTFSYPVTVSSEATLRVDTLDFSNDRINPGEAFNMAVNIFNTGGNAKDVRISANSTYFSFKGVSQIIVGDLEKNSNFSAIFPMTAGVSVTPGLYAIPLTITYEDQLGNTQTALVSAGPVNIYESIIIFDVVPYFPYKDYAGPGEKISLHVPITNVGDGSAESVRVKISSSDSSFIPVGSSEKYIDAIAPGEKQEAVFEVGISSTATPGYYTLKVEVEFTDSRGQEQTPELHTAGFRVIGVSDTGIIVTPNPSPMTPGGKYSLAVQISNIGTSELKALRVTTGTPALTFLTPQDAYIGTLSLDDYSTVQYQVYADSKLAPGTYPIYINMTFRDASNIEKFVQKTAYIQVVPVSLAKVGQAQGGLTMLEIILLLILGAIVLYWVYGRFFRKRGK